MKYVDYDVIKNLIVIFSYINGITYWSRKIDQTWRKGYEMHSDIKS